MKCLDFIERIAVQMAHVVEVTTAEGHLVDAIILLGSATYHLIGLKQTDGALEFSQAADIIRNDLHCHRVDADIFLLGGCRLLCLLPGVGLLSTRLCRLSLLDWLALLG